MLRVGDIAPEWYNVGAVGKCVSRGLECVGTAGVDDEGPALVGQAVRQREAEPAGAAGDERNGAAVGQGIRSRHIGRFILKVNLRSRPEDLRTGSVAPTD